MKFDVNGGSSKTQPGWVGVEPKTGVGKNGTYVLTLSPIVRNFNRDRGVAKTKHGQDNDDNAVPIGEFAPMYRDFMFILPGKLSGTISGLAPGTSYPVTVFSWDSAQGDLNATGWGAKGGKKKRITFSGDFATDTRMSVDPDTRKARDYSVTFIVEADASGNLVFEGVSMEKSSVIILNGVVVGDPIATLKPVFKSNP